MLPKDYDLLLPSRKFHIVAGCNARPVICWPIKPDDERHWHSDHKYIKPLDDVDQRKFCFFLATSISIFSFRFDSYVPREKL